MERWLWSGLGRLARSQTHSITLTYLLEADSEVKLQTRSRSKFANTEPTQPVELVAGAAPGGLPSGFAAGKPTVQTSDTAGEQILDLLQSFPELRSLLGDSRTVEQKLDGASPRQASTGGGGLVYRNYPEVGRVGGACPGC